MRMPRTRQAVSESSASSRRVKASSLPPLPRKRRGRGTTRLGGNGRARSPCRAGRQFLPTDMAEKKESRRSRRIIGLFIACK